MSNIPTRLLVISARVPDGEKCIPAGAKTGCQFLGVSSTHYIPRCHLYEEDMCDLDRLPACRERDGWVCYPPGSHVAELVEAAKVYAATARRTREHQEALGDLRGAARNVAEETIDVPRD